MIYTKRTKEYRTTEEETEGPTSFWGSRNRKHAQTFRNMMMVKQYYFCAGTQRYGTFIDSEAVDEY